MINFAHGDFIMMARTLFYTIPLMVRAGMPAWLAVLAVLVVRYVCSVVGVLVEIMPTGRFGRRVPCRPLSRRSR
jgi:branched-chain amino acid transport system permease protein